jgi:2-polyprenyl-3-methyl-5-hydroxy-6-metoxy-1,4-benzoquinol methylase
MGGGADQDAAFEWLCDRGNSGDFLILRARGDDAYNPYVNGLCKTNSVSTLIIPDATAARNARVAEIIRSAEEAREFTFKTINRAQIERYLAPPADTPYPLEYAFHLLGNLCGKTVVDLGCGKGANLIPLAERGARVTGIDISPDLIRLAQQRVDAAGVSAKVCVGSVYETGLESESVDMVFCVSLIHHLEIPRARDEMWRILKKGGFVVLSEPIRFSRFYGRVRKLFPPHKNASPFEHPLSRAELASMSARFLVEGQRYFSLPFVRLVERFLLRSASPFSRKLSAWTLRVFPPSQHLATAVVLKLNKK